MRHQEAFRIGRNRTTLAGGLGSGVQPEMLRAHSRALALSAMPGNSRRSSTAADSSPSCSKIVRIAAASATPPYQAGKFPTNDRCLLKRPRWSENAMVSILKASVQYNDWRGTCAADDADNRALRSFLQEKGLSKGTDFLVGIDLWIGENHHGRVQEPTVTALVIEGLEDHADVSEFIKQKNPIPMKRIDIEITLNEFMGLFKRFKVVLSPPSLGLEDREYTAPC
ncbi:MAG: hypothetical protein ABSC06_40150 [Rhodopila sp.]